jgi:hypothetical protein
VCFIVLAVGLLGEKISNTEYGRNVFFRIFISAPVDENYAKYPL